MKKFLLLLLAANGCLYSTSQITSPVPAPAYDHLFRFYTDNDFINILGNGTDEAYTGGFRFDYLYNKKKAPKLIDKWMPKAGSAAVNTYGWSLMQLSYTPTDITATEPRINDFPYSGALFAVHSLHSFNPEKKWGIRTAIMAGVMGPASFAQKTQDWIHSIIGYQKGNGWQYQMPNDVLLNLDVTAQRMLYSNRWFEVQGGGTINAGTFQTGAAIFSIFRIGKMQPYFNGIISQLSTPKHTGQSRFQIYAQVTPAVEWVGYYAPLDGGVFAGKNEYYTQSKDGVQPYKTDKRINVSAAGMVGIAAGKFGITFTQKVMRPMIKGIKPQEVGNISFHLSW